MHSHPTESSGVEEVGAHQFRNLFGWYMQRAAAGEGAIAARLGAGVASEEGTGHRETVEDEGLAVSRSTRRVNSVSAIRAGSRR
jgi:hypothetical protein